MESRQAYNRLMISPLVYNALAGCSHVLVHEPDAMVLRDELDYWCRQSFDYIGAPWFDGFAAAKPNARLIGVGNFGLSLLRLEAVTEVLGSRQRWYPWSRIARDLTKGLSGSAGRLRQACRAITATGQLRKAWQIYDGHCDIFWSEIVPHIVPSFRIAPIDQAIRFCWEVLPAQCFDMCNRQLPFGFHAWSKYDRHFLTPHLIASGVVL
jgi:hypothetical protein